MTAIFDVNLPRKPAGCIGLYRLLQVGFVKFSFFLKINSAFCRQNSVKYCFFLLLKREEEEEGLGTYTNNMLQIHSNMGWAEHVMVKLREGERERKRERIQALKAVCTLRLRCGD